MIQPDQFEHFTFEHLQQKGNGRLPSCPVSIYYSDNQKTVE